MNLEDPMTKRQRDRLKDLGIKHDDDLTIGEAADLIRSECHAVVYMAPMRLPETAMAVEGEGDRGDGRQWLP